MDEYFVRARTQDRANIGTKIQTTFTSFSTPVPLHRDCNRHSDRKGIRRLLFMINWKLYCTLAGSDPGAVVKRKLWKNSIHIQRKMV